MSKAIQLDTVVWDKVKAQIREDYNPSVLLLRSKMRSVLGFTDRTYHRYDEKTHQHHRKVCLDFFDEHKRLMFLLKYGEYL